MQLFSFPIFKQAQVYIENIRKKYGSYSHVETITRFDPNLLNFYISDLIPGAVNNQELLSPIASNGSTDSIFNLDVSTEIKDDRTDDMPVRKRARLAHNKGSERNQSFVIDSSVESNIEASVVVSNTVVANPIENDNINQIMTKCRMIMMESTKNSTKAFETVCELTAKLADHQKNKVTDQKMIDELKMKIGELEAKKAEYEKIIEKKNIELTNAVNEVKKQCEEDFVQRFESAKKMKFCVACDTAKPQHKFHFCDSDCQKRYWYVIKKYFG